MIEALKKIGARALEHVREHKLLYGVGAIGAGLGYLFVSEAAAARPPPLLPGTKGVTPVTGGGLSVQTKTGPVVIPPPASVKTGQALWVTTSDPAPEGNLRARSGPGPNHAPVGYFPKNGPVTVLAGPDNGFLRVQGPGIDNSGNPLAALEGWASMAYLKPADQNPVGAQLGFLHDLGIL